MKKNILTLFSLALLFTVVACTSSSIESASTASDIQMKAQRSAPSANQEEDLNILLARKWQNESGEIFIDLKIDGSFEGKFDSDNTIIGSWTVSDDQKKLSLKEDNAAEGKGSNLKLVYTILDMSFNDMKVLDQEGNEFTFVSPDY